MSDLFSGLQAFTKSVSSTLNSYEVRKIGDKVQSYVLNFTETELKVREATNEDPWGPTGPQMQEIAQLTTHYDAFPEIMGMLWKRMLHDNKLAWRRVYKSLILLNNLLKTGSERVIANAKDRLFEMRALESYSCVDERGRDQGVNIRHRVKQIIELLQDDELLAEERHKTKTENKDKYQGFSKEDMLYKGNNKGSKISSFESWNEKSFKNSKSNNFDFPEIREKDREVTSFDFDGSQNRSASPELGIPDHSQKRRSVNEDDEFGDFADARTSSKPVANAEPDFFGDFSSPTQEISGSRLPKPPSAPTSPIPNNNISPANQLEATLFDLGPSEHIASPNNAAFDLFPTPNVFQSAPAPSSNVDIFGDFTASAPTTNVANNSKPNNDFDIFGDFGSSSAVPSNSSSSAAISGWGDLIAPTPIQQPKSSETKSPEPKMDDGWSLMEKQLDGLTFGNKKKPAMSLNEMRTQKS